MENHTHDEDVDLSLKILSRATALIMTVIYAIYVSDVVYNFLPQGWFLDFLTTCVYFGPLAICALLAIEAILKKGLVIKIIIIAVWVIIFLFSFFPATFYNLFF